MFDAALRKGRDTLFISGLTSKLVSCSLIEYAAI